MKLVNEMLHCLFIFKKRLGSKSKLCDANNKTGKDIIEKKTSWLCVKIESSLKYQKMWPFNDKEG